MRQISLYIHVPFCTRRCSYCSFYHVPSAKSREEAFVDALAGEIHAAFAEIGEPFALHTVFVGGGTPTVLDDALWRRIVDAIAPRFPAGGPAEFTVEMNPEDVARARVRFLRSLGVNRASIGIQSMHPVGQKVLKRCAPDVNARAIDVVRETFDNVSFDVLLGVPKTTASDLAATMRALLEREPRHLSVYGLEPGGDMSHEVERFFQAVDPDRVADEYLGVCDTLRARGFRHYEVSNFARPGFESLHNRVYWDGGDYLGVGPAAHSALGGRRFWNAPSLDAYLRRRGGQHLAARVRDESGDGPIERVMLALRTDRGAPAAWFAPARTREFAADGLLEVREGRVFATDRGFLVLNDLVLRLSEPATGSESIC
ncbi:MAG TPA: coproporphyrinogen-III oxidase family protein [Candidatus Krumholzibacteria bacterium]|nr:coproporphyrinogen-III oxidase family protein [Candidatus Krumholzibacteria bacterium]